MIALPPPLLQAARPSFATGFAKNASESAFPTLWNGLKAAWCPSIGIQGRRLWDFSGNGRHGTFSAGMLMSAWVPSPWGYALLYDGTDDFIDLGANFHDMNQSWTMFARARIDDLTHNQYTLFGASASGSATSGYFLFLQRADKSNGYIFQYDTGPGSGTYSATPNRAPTANKWHTHMVRRAAPGGMTVFQDGYTTILDGTNPNFSPTNTQNWGIGTWDPINGTNCFKGQIGDVLFWNRPLSSWEMYLVSERNAHPLQLREEYVLSPHFVRGGIAAGSMMLMGVGN